MWHPLLPLKMQPALERVGVFSAKQPISPGQITSLARSLVIHLVKAVAKRSSQTGAIPLGPTLGMAPQVPLVVMPLHPVTLQGRFHREASLAAKQLTMAMGMPPAMRPATRQVRLLAMLTAALQGRFHKAGGARCRTDRHPPDVIS